MMQKKVWKGIKGITTMMYMLADNIGLIDIDSIYSDKMKAICGTGNLSAGITPSATRDVKKLQADVRETDEEIILNIELPGVEKKDIDITTTGNEIYIRAKRPHGLEGKSGDYYTLF